MEDGGGGGKQQKRGRRTGIWITEKKRKRDGDDKW